MLRAPQNDSVVESLITTAWHLALYDMFQFTVNSDGSLSAGALLISCFGVSHYPIEPSRLSGNSTIYVVHNAEIRELHDLGGL